jgi:hypothetical protein
LLGFFGSGAILGALVLPGVRARLSTAAVLSSALLVVSATLLVSGILKSIWPLCAFMIFGGAGWITFISTLNTMMQQLAPSWVRARVLAAFLLVFQGTVTLGSFVWGFVAQRRGIAFAFLLAGAGTAASILLRFFARLPETDADLSPWLHWNTPSLVAMPEFDPEDGPVLVAIEYHVDPSRAAMFIEAAHRLGRLRRRDGASRWGIFRDLEKSDRYVETFIVDSWSEHLRQHERSVRADRSIEEAVSRSAREAPIVRHLLYASRADVSGQPHTGEEESRRSRD